MGMVYKSGQMVQSMRDTGKTTKPMVMDHFINRMVICIKDVGRIIWFTDLANIRIKMELNMKEIGNLICNMVLEKKFGRTIQYMRVTIIKERNKEMVTTHGQMALSSLVIGTITK